MPKEQLIEIAEKYNAMLDTFVRQQNEQHPIGRKLHIYDLNDPADLDMLRKHGYGVSVCNQPRMKNLYERDKSTSRWVDKVLREGGREYQTIKRKNDIQSLVDCVMSSDAGVQRGLCVVGRNDEAHEFEVHEYGRECLIPRFFNAITLVTYGYDSKIPGIDRDSARLVYMPASDSILYRFNTKAGHYMPHVLAVMEVMLLDGTGNPLDFREKLAVWQTGHIAKNIVLASDRKKDGTKAKVVGKTETIEVIQRLQEKTDAEIRPELERLLGVEENH